MVNEKLIFHGSCCAGYKTHSNEVGNIASLTRLNWAFSLQSPCGFTLMTLRPNRSFSADGPVVYQCLHSAATALAIRDAAHVGHRSERRIHFPVPSVRMKYLEAKTTYLKS